MKKTKIDWCDCTINPVVGCKNGCKYCYAEKINDRFKFIPCWRKPQFFEDRLKQLKSKKSKSVFIDSMSDIGWWENEWLEKTFEAYPKWDSIPNGTEMDVGDPLIYGGIKVVKGKGLIKLPDDTIEPIAYNHLFEGTCNLLYYGMTASRGWEWFDSVRNEDRFKEYIERAKKMADK